MDERAEIAGRIEDFDTVRKRASVAMDEWRETDRGLQRTTTRLEAVLHEHQEVLSVLRERMGPVLLPEGPMPGLLSGVDREVVSPVAERIEGLISTAQNTSGQIRDLLDRLDL